MTERLIPVDLHEPILVLGAYGYRNVGDEAILSGLLASLPRGARVSVVSRAPAETRALHGVPTVAIASAAWQLRRHRSVLIGGGGLFGRDLGRLGRLVAPFGLAAAALGRTVAIAGVGVDPRLPATTVVALKLLAARSAGFSVRDTASRDVLREWGIEAEISGDLSARLPAASRREAQAILRAAGLSPARPIVGLCLTGVEPIAGIERAVAELVAAFPSVQFCFIPMSQHPFVASHNDLLLGQRLRAASPRITLLAGFFPPRQVLAIFSLLSSAICMRYHSLLFAERAGIPIVAIPYAEKCRTWMTERGIAPSQPTGEHLIADLAAALKQDLAWSA